MTYDSDDDGFLSSDDDEAYIIQRGKDNFNDTAVGTGRHIGGMDITKTIDDDEYMLERVRRERAYQWHSRWALPTYKQMKAQVRNAKGSMDITEDDVDLLPWTAGGMLNMREYHRMQRNTGGGPGVSVKSPRRQKREQKGPITLHVELPTGRTIAISGIKPDQDTAADLRAKIQQHEPTLEAKRQVLMRDGEKLPVGETCNDMKLQNGDHLQLSMKKVPITVCNKVNGKEYTLFVDTSQPVAQLKRDLEAKCDIPMNNQRLLLQPNNTELNDDRRPAEEYGIQGGSKVDLYPNSVQVQVTMPDGRKFPLHVGMNDTTDNIKAKIENKTGMEADDQILTKGNTILPEDGKTTAAEMGFKEGDEIHVTDRNVPITVKTMEGDEFELQVDPDNTTVRDLKDILEQVSGLSTPQQLLTRKGKELSNNDSPLSEYKVKKGTVLELEPKFFQVHVTMPDGSQVPLEVSPNDTSSDIKKKIEHKTGMKANNQILKNSDQDELPNGVTARDLGMRHGDELHVDPKTITVSVEMPDGSRRVPITIDPHETTADDIKEAIQAKTGLEAARQVLKDGRRGRELPNGQTAQAMGLKEGDDLKVGIRQVPVTVRTMDGDQLQIMVDPIGDSIADLKGKIAKASGGKLPANNQKLFKDGQELDHDHKTADDYDIQEGTVLDVEPKHMNVSVLMPDGKRVPLSIEPSDTPNDIKDKIAQKTGMPADRQVLKQHGDTLPNHQTAKDIGIRNGDDSLQVETMKVPVQVNLPNHGKTVEIMVDPHAPLEQIKRDLEPASGIAVRNQNLYKDGDLLPDNHKNAGDYGIQAGTVLDLEDDEERRRQERERFRMEEEQRKQQEEDARKAKEEAAAERRRNMYKSGRPPPVTMGDDPLERAYRWYTRIQNPHYTGMCQMVRELPAIDITVDDVGLLPWVKNGKILDFVILAEKLDKIVAERKARGLPF